MLGIIHCIKMMLDICKIWFQRYWFILRWCLENEICPLLSFLLINIFSNHRLLDSVPPTAIGHFKQSAEKLIEEKGAVEALAAALAHISGATSVDQRSLINSDVVRVPVKFLTLYNVEFEQDSKVFRWNFPVVLTFSWRLRYIYKNTNPGLPWWRSGWESAC